MSQGRPWAGVFTAEAGLLIGGAAFNDETRMRTGALLNILWDGEPIRRTRVGTGTHFLPGRRCSVHLMMQPNVAAQLFGDSTLDGIGTLARTLLVAPESTAGTRLWREPGMGAHWGLGGYESRMEALLSRQPRCVRDNPDVLDPIALTLVPEAREKWIVFHDQVEIGMRVDGEFASIRAFASKMPEHAGRLAAVLQVMDDPESTEVSAEAMASLCVRAVTGEGCRVGPA
jgi:Protein of unknown function (DUF3987)